MDIDSRSTLQNASQPVLQVAVGVIKNSSGQILISFRDTRLHQGGLWEFPGGKIEAMETSEQALIRELKEELDITVSTATPLITINHQYPDLAVRLHVFSVENFMGEAKSEEGQAIKWVEVDDLPNYAFPAANQPIIAAARLPYFYAILDDAKPQLLLNNLNLMLNKGIKLIQARLKTLSAKQVETFIETAYPLCKRHNAMLLLNSASTGVESFNVDGIHLSSQHLLAADKRPEHRQWISASCHTLAELRHAQHIGVDFAVLAPVLPTPTHPDAKVLGWEHFNELVAQVNLPVFALGGLGQNELEIARNAGAQGIAGIRAFL
ncbi:MAG: Nudix family hydrolase [Methyloglobulus sp.]